VRDSGIKGKRETRKQGKEGNLGNKGKGEIKETGKEGKEERGK
jgi:hypothetical protein